VSKLDEIQILIDRLPQVAQVRCGCVADIVRQLFEKDLAGESSLAVELVLTERSVELVGFADGRLGCARCGAYADNVTHAIVHKANCGIPS
jgi:hypothetical protein